MAALVISKIFDCSIGSILLYCDKEAKLDLGTKQKMILSPKPHTRSPLKLVNCQSPSLN
ncbi:unnamed protein product [Brassica oleracea var. botrytis]|uniref:(rape) hypothetical protein n=1 Tax=Brassica napus TaxID=3708 RepID=A0A816IRJ4_BRANA|nr:unnamed protein product [Brassica napus]